MWAAAFYTKTIPCTLTYSVAIIIYNEGGLAAVPVMKNVIGAVGLACYCWGTTVILGTVPKHMLFWAKTRPTLTWSKIMGGSCMV